MGDRISMLISFKSPSDETLNQGLLALLLWRQYKIPFGINIVQFWIFRLFFFFSILSAELQRLNVKKRIRMKDSGFNAWRPSLTPASTTDVMVKVLNASSGQRLDHYNNTITGGQERWKEANMRYREKKEDSSSFFSFLSTLFLSISRLFIHTRIQISIWGSHL